MKIKKSIDRITRPLYVFTLVFFGFVMMASAKSPIIVINPGYRLVINQDKGTIESFQATIGGRNDELLVPKHGQLPMFKIEFLSGQSKFQNVTSSEARKVSVTKTTQESGDIISLYFEGIGNLELNVRVTVRCPKDKPLTYWSMELDNRTSMWIGHIQFPVVEIPFDENP